MSEGEIDTNAPDGDKHDPSLDDVLDFADKAARLTRVDGSDQPGIVRGTYRVSDGEAVRVLVNPKQDDEILIDTDASCVEVL